MTSPLALRMDESMRLVDPLPLLPATWMVLNEASGWPSLSSSLLIRSSLASLTSPGLVEEGGVKESSHAVTSSKLVKHMGRIIQRKASRWKGEGKACAKGHLA